MKKMNLLEARLRSWQPRRPSARLKRRIFLESPGAPRLLPWSLRCLVPAAACLLVALATLNQGGSVAVGISRPGPADMTLSNQLAYLPPHYQQEQNRVARVTFGWTNRSDSTSSIGSFLPAR